jgi:hypothetical protein
MARSTPRTARTVRLRPHDAFDLIRLLARSQSDPRKAVAELVQNSLDAGAKHIELSWLNDKGLRSLRIWDDGQGVFPELPREEALRRIAHTIGYSHKRDLSPAQRKELMIQGQYGIGLIGFWSVGQVLEMKSRVGGDKAWVLRMFEDRARGDVEVSRSRKIDEPETYTQVTIQGVHESAQNKVRPPRLQAYLAGELRGQLLERGAVVRIVDRVARGRARKEFIVEPRPYLGLPLETWREFEVPGFENARVELYAVAPEDERRGVVTLSCGGTVVLDDIAEIDGSDERRAPWGEGRLEGVIDFPELHVSPGTRRGFAHDEPVAAFLVALAGLEQELAEHFEAERRRHAALRREHLARDIRKAFRPVVSRLHDYDFFSLRAAAGAAPTGAAGNGGALGRGDTAAAEGGAALELPEQEASRAPEAEDPRAPDEAQESDGQLFPPGPLARLEARPRKLRLPALATRSLRVLALDADGRACAGEVDFSWLLVGPGELRAEGARAAYTAPDLDALEAEEPLVRVVASQGETRVGAEVPVQLQPASSADARTSGIPDPRPVNAPGEAWRSRLVEGRWEYNADHRDYLAASETEARRLRYLVNLFAKEIVLRNFGGPADAQVLERMVEVLTYLDKGARSG